MSIVRRTLGGVLAGGAKALSLTSKVLDATARTLRPDARGAEETPVERAPGRRAVEPPRDADSTSAVVAEVADKAPDRGRVVEPPFDTLDETAHVRTSDSHIEELAEKTVAEVTAAIGDLSTDELRLLTEYEVAHKNRRTVLTAIERALTPPAGGSGAVTREREIVLPEAGGVPTSGKMRPTP